MSGVFTSVLENQFTESEKVAALFRLFYFCMLLLGNLFQQKKAAAKLKARVDDKIIETDELSGRERPALS